MAQRLSQNTVFTPSTRHPSQLMCSGRIGALFNSAHSFAVFSQSVIVMYRSDIGIAFFAVNAAITNGSSHSFPSKTSKLYALSRFFQSGILSWWLNQTVFPKCLQFLFQKNPITDLIHSITPNQRNKRGTA